MIKSRGYRLTLLLLLQFCLVPSMAYGQGNLLYYNRVDTLSFWNRVNLSTNMVDWAVLTPNVGVEFAIGNKNWNKWTIGAYGRLNWNTNSKENAYYVYDLYGGRIELRKYWHANMPKRVFYIGAYGGINKFDIKLGAIGKSGQSFVGGLTFGTVTQLYGYQNGSSIDLDLGINAGVVFAKYHEYYREFINDKYVYTKIKPEDGYKVTFSPLIYAASTDVLRVSFIYHFGTKLSNRYKKRILIDNDYRIALEAARIRRDSLTTALEKRKREVTDSLEREDYEKRFEQQRLELEKKYREDSLKIVNQALKVEALKAKEEAKKIADSLKIVNREKAIEEANTKKRIADSLKIVNKEKIIEGKNARRRAADSLDNVRKIQEQETVTLKQKRKEEAQREKDSLKVAKEVQRQAVIKAKEEEKLLRKKQKEEKKQKSKNESAPAETTSADASMPKETEEPTTVDSENNKE